MFFWEHTVDDPDDAGDGQVDVVESLVPFDDFLVEELFLLFLGEIGWCLVHPVHFVLRKMGG